MMIQSCGFVPHRPLTIVSFAAARSDNLRAQLNSLHLEAESTRIKANNARLRLMRLSEAAEKLRQQAAVDVRVGREGEARELLLQKRKVMQALEKSKSRIEVLDKLSTKLNEAISVKESQLIGSVASGLEVNIEDTPSPVRVIPPKEGVSQEPNKNNELDIISTEFEKAQELVLRKECQANLPVGYRQGDSEGGVSIETRNEDEKVSDFKSVHSNKKHLEQLLDEVESELATILRLSTLLIKSEQIQNNSKGQLIMEVLEALHGIRAKIASSMKTETDSS